jgi:hypothetical protein
LEGHVQAFGYWGGVPTSILYDNTKLAVSKILGDGERLKTRAFSELQSHYLFADKFGRPGKGNDKGNVEGLVGCLQSTLRAGIDDGDQQFTLPGMDGGPQFGTADRRLTGPAHSPCTHSRNEWRELSPEAEQAQARKLLTIRQGTR